MLGTVRNHACVTTEEHAQGAGVPRADDIFGQSPPPQASASAGWVPPPAYLDELTLAAERNEASFPQTYMARILARDLRFGPAVNSQVAALIPRLLAGFQNRYGNIIDSRYGFVCTAGAVLLERIDHQEPEDDAAGGWSRVTHQFSARGIGAAQTPLGPRDRSPRAGDLDAFVWWKVLHFNSQDATELLADILSLRDRIITFLPDPVSREADARDIGVRTLFAIATELTESVDDEEQRWLDVLTARWYESVEKPPKPTFAGMPLTNPLLQNSAGAPDLQWQQELSEIAAYREQNKDQRPSERFVRNVASLRGRLAHEEVSYLAAVQRVAQHAYISGMFKGFACLLALLIGLAVATGAIGFDAGWLTTATLGGTGAVLSVLQRLGRGLDLAPEGEKQSFMQQGFVRPWIGSLLGIASFVLLKGGLISIATPSGTADKILYYGGIAFLAGFSERFAQDMLAAPGPANTAQLEAAGANKSVRN